MRKLLLALAAVMVLLGAGSARAETSIYVAEQPGLFLVLKAEGAEVYATYLSATVICRGAGSHWGESNEATHRAFEDGPVKLRRSGARVRLAHHRMDQFDSSREVIEGRIQPGGIVGSFSLFTSGEGIGGSCESDSPGFEPHFGEREPPVAFEAQRYVPLADPVASAPDPAAEAFYLYGSEDLEVLLRLDGREVTQVLGTAGERCRTTAGAQRHRRRPLGIAPPFPLVEDRFDRYLPIREAGRFGSRRLTGRLASDAVVGTFRAGIGYWKEDGDQVARCATVGPGNYLHYRALRYVPVK